MKKLLLLSLLAFAPLSAHAADGGTYYQLQAVEPTEPAPRPTPILPDPRTGRCPEGTIYTCVEAGEEGCIRSECISVPN